MYIKTYIGLFLLQIQTVHSGAGNRYTYMKSKSKNITTSTNASRDLLTTQATTTIMSTNLFTHQCQCCCQQQQQQSDWYSTAEHFQLC